MTFVSVTQASRGLGIDAKTLHRWLAEAQLALQSHPCDGRQKGLSREHLALLARLHQRQLAPLPEQEPAALPAEGPALPAALLTLPEQLEALQAQISALQQQVKELTCLLHPPTHQLVSLSAPTEPSRRSKQPPRAVPSIPPTNVRRQPTHVIPRVEYGEQGRYVLICPKSGLLPFEPDTPAWFAWLATQSSFRFVGKAGHFTAHHRVKYGAWRAHRHIRNHSYNLRLAPTQQLTLAVLEQAAQALQAHLT